MRNKIKLPKDAVLLCEIIAKGYERRKKDYEKRRLDIIYESGGSFADYAGGTRGTNVSDPIARKAERLEGLDEGLDARFIRAVEQSLISVGEDVSRDSRERLRKAIILNCENGKAYPYEILDVSEFSKSDFYRRKKRFIIGIGVILGLVDG